MTTSKHGLTTVHLASKQEIVQLKRKRPADPTAWQLYRAQHPNQNPLQALQGFVMATFYLIGGILLFVYVASNSAALVGADKPGNWQVGLLWTAAIGYGFWQLCKHFSDRFDR